MVMLDHGITDGMLKSFKISSLILAATEDILFS